MSKQLEQVMYDATLESVIDIQCTLIITTAAAIGDQHPVVKALQRCLQDVTPHRSEEAKSKMDRNRLIKAQKQ